MSTYDFFWALGNGIENFLAIFYDHIVRYFNFFLIIFGFAAFFYWMMWQSKLIKKADNDPNQIK